MLEMDVTKGSGFRSLSQNELEVVTGGTGGILPVIWREFLKGVAGEVGSQVGEQVMEGITEDGEATITAQFDPTQSIETEWMNGDGEIIQGFTVGQYHYFDYDGNGYLDTRVYYNEEGTMFVDNGEGWRIVYLPGTEPWDFQADTLGTDAAA